MRVVLDTNVLISEAISPLGIPAAILRYWRDGRYELYLSAAILTEFTQVMQRPSVARRLRRDPQWIRSLMLAFASAAHIVQPVQITVIARDPTDDQIVGTAIAAAAHYLVSGNDHLLELESYDGIQIVTPRRFLDLLDSRG